MNPLSEKEGAHRQCRSVSLGFARRVVRITNPALSVVRDVLQNIPNSGEIGRAAAAYYLSSNNIPKLTLCNFTKTELEQMTEARLPNYAQKLHAETLADASNLIGANAADLSALNAAITALRQVIEDPKRAIEISKRYNDSIDGHIKDADKHRRIIDIYMQTFIDQNPGLYTEWELSMGIDDLPTHAAPDFTTPVTALPNASSSVDYAALGGLSGDTEIEFTLSGNTTQGLRAGFGIDKLSISPGKELQLTSGGSNRHSATSLGFDIDTTPFLNIINDTAQAVSVMVNFYSEG